MKELDREFFRKSVDFAIVYFPEARSIGQFVKSHRKDLLAVPTIPHVMKSPTEADPARKGVILTHNINNFANWKDFVAPETAATIAALNGTVEKFLYALTYDFWKTDEILNAILPTELCGEIPSGFTVCGHVAHFNLKNEFKPWGKLLGQVTLDKNAHIRTVVDKVDSIATKFRTFKMKLLAGDDDMLVEQRESGCRFQFDFSSVYWNSRLHTEHERLVALFQPGEVVGDVMAGVGPFAIPGGRKKVIVMANDLNPEAHKYLVKNIALNKVSEFVTPHNMDGREFIIRSPRMLLDYANAKKEISVTRPAKKRKTNEGIAENTSVVIPKFYSHYVMNLPDSALTFLDSFIGLYSDPEVRDVVKLVPEFKLPTIHVHCFEKWEYDETPEPSMEELHKRVYRKICELIEFDAPFNSFSFHLVRWVAPTKPMFCVSFKLPEKVAFRSGVTDPYLLVFALIEISNWNKF
ncbi:hypothetical protein BABINDRAFT_171055 [Babjeviella inositovora NRRL Y-12698]|uniref:tRNA (guanine(37)-N1)-methyltransferase n=1 Tax=Babjeviella inositovora NRRL Y-12698 TaxID=984486 RepID=A0A1E3QSV9_9ASCO|nr:uncharacterized protein BABINDRAFT_171055 [Babjeviella inositovora NRRL Y-12698]ODQ80728.1 hypothetical protein BABINDRAFT_171055 [Babjeviella inositovora NRRL Y-12698]